MGNVRVIDVHQSVYAVNDEIAAKTRARLKEDDMDRVKDNIAKRNPKAVVFPISARTGEGMDAWCEWLKCYVAQYLGENQNG